MKTALRGIAMFLIFGIALSADGANDITAWFIGSLVTLALVGLMFWIADRLPDKPRHRRRRKAGEHYAQRRA